jgi:hypothetical protein
MNDSNFIKLLRKCSKNELKAFRDYVFSPFFNKNQKVQRLCDYVLNYAPDFRHSDLNKQIIFPKLFENRDYDRLPINNVISDLYQLLLDFLAFQELSERPQRLMDFQLKALLKKEMTQLAEQRIRRFHQLQSDSKWQDYEFFQHEYALFENLDELFLTHQKRGYDENLQKKSDAFDVFYFANKLRMACDMASRNVVLNANYECRYLAVFLDDFHNEGTTNKLKEPKGWAEIPVIKIYVTTLLMLENPNEEVHYFEVKKLLQNHFDLFPKSELTGIYSFLLNFCIRKINFGKGEFYSEILELYKVLLKRELIFKNEFLTQWTFRNIVTAGIRSNELDWAEKFILEYQNRLLPEERKNSVSYNLAAVYFAKKDYRSALQLLQNLSFSDNFYQIGTKTIQLKSYFELEETEAFYSLVSAFLKYLRRNTQLSDYHKELNVNFVKITKDIFRLKTSKDLISEKVFQKNKTVIFEKLKDLKTVAERDWLMGYFRNA